MQFSSSSTEVKQEYKGKWYEGQMGGFGTMIYTNGSEYIGYWKNDTRDGHGSLRTYSLERNALQTFYVGDWQNDQKNGYGVQDFLPQ